MFFFCQNVFAGQKKPAKIIWKKIVSLHGNIKRTQFDQKSSRPPEEGGFELLQTHRQTSRQTDKHGDTMTESDQRG